MDKEQILDFLEPSKYTAIIEELKANLDNIRWDGQHLYIQKHELMWRVKDENVKNVIKDLFTINNNISNTYRMRSGIIKYKRVIDE